MCNKFHIAFQFTRVHNGCMNNNYKRMLFKIVLDGVLKIVLDGPSKSNSHQLPKSSRVQTLGRACCDRAFINEIGTRLQSTRPLGFVLKQTHSVDVSFNTPVWLSARLVFELFFLFLLAPHPNCFLWAWSECESLNDFLVWLLFEPRPAASLGLISLDFTRLSSWRCQPLFFPQRDTCISWS